MNDVRVSPEYLKRSTEAGTSLLGASPTGEFCATYAAHRSEAVERLVLSNPQSDYRARVRRSVRRGRRRTA
jgi:uncharacterized protein